MKLSHLRGAGRMVGVSQLWEWGVARMIFRPSLLPATVVPAAARTALCLISPKVNCNPKEPHRALCTSARKPAPAALAPTLAKMLEHPSISGMVDCGVLCKPAMRR